MGRYDPLSVAIDAVALNAVLGEELGAATNSFRVRRAFAEQPGRGGFSAAFAQYFGNLRLQATVLLQFILVVNPVGQRHGLGTGSELRGSCRPATGGCDDAPK